MLNNICTVRKCKLIVILVVCLVPINMLLAQTTMPSLEERIYALSLIWKEVCYNFAYPEVLQKVKPDSLYLVYLPQVSQAKNKVEYCRVLRSFLAKFNDAHTRIFEAYRPDDTPPIKIINFEEKIIISNISKGMANRIPVGSEIIKVNHVPVLKYIKDSVYQYISAATPHWKFNKAVNEMLFGQPLSKVNITIRTPKGKVYEEEIVRNYYSNGTKDVMVDSIIWPIKIAIIKDNVGYIRLTSFDKKYKDTINSVFESYLPQLKKCKGLIIDIRGNSGGSQLSWENILYHLVLESNFQEKGKYFSRKFIPTYKMWGKFDLQFRNYYQGTAMEEIKYFPFTNKLNDSLKLHQPLIIISGEGVGSASEYFLILMKDCGRATVVGGPSAGNVGEPMMFTVPGNLDVMICAKKYVNPDGTQPNETGILPDIQVKQDYSVYLKGEDNVLECALKEIKKRIMK
jgi:carboxyl-terminal processing protease